MKQYAYKIDGSNYDVTIQEIQGNVAKIKVNGICFDVEMLSSSLTMEELPNVTTNVEATTTAKETPKAEATPAQATPAGEGTAVKAPLPGVIIGVKVAVGQEVKKGDTLVVLEAMKMENNINAEADGVVTSICVNQGDSVMEGTTLITVK